MNPLKFLVLALLAPRFFRDMPRPMAGAFIAGGQMYSPWYTHSAVEQRVVGRLRAYLTARWIAYQIDQRRVTDEVGIRWFVRSTN